MRYVYLFLLLTSITFLSCDKSMDSKLRGRWQLRFEKPAESSIHNVDSIFYSFDNNVISLQNVERPTYTRQAFGKYTINNDSIIFEYVDWDGTHDFYKNKKIIIGYLERYRIIELSTENMHLRSKDRELFFRKF